MKGDEVRIWDDNALGLWLDSCPGYKAAKKADREHAGLARSLGEVVRILRARGWFVRLDHEVDSLIRFHHRVGINRRSGLEVTVKLCGRHLAVEFFQNIQNIENPNGGRYECGKFERMTYVQKLEAVHLIGLISERLAELHDCPIIRKRRRPSRPSRRGLDDQKRPMGQGKALLQPQQHVDSQDLEAFSGS